MPSLVHLIIAGPRFPEREKFRSSISHSEHLDILEIETEDCDDLRENLESISHMTPTISQLRIHGMGKHILPTSVLDRLATGELLPKLSKLECAVQDAQDVIAYLDMIERRCFQVRLAVSSTIKEVRFFTGGASMDGIWLPRLNKLREGGMIVHVSDDSFHKALIFV